MSDWVVLRIPGRYVAADILYQLGDAFYPSDKKEQYEETEKESGD